LQGNWQNKFAVDLERLGALKPIDLFHDSVTLWLISLEVWQIATAFLFRFTSITYVADFIGDLTRRGKYDFLSPLQPKSGFLPEAGRGRPKLLKVEDGAQGFRQRSHRATFKAKPVS
jgi:hypothetical protein